MRSLFAPALLCALLTSQPGLGAIVENYGYPFTDPLVATVIGTRRIEPDEPRVRSARRQGRRRI